MVDVLGLIRRVTGLMRLTVLSNCALVAPHLIATAMPCMISGASAPHMDAPRTLSLSASTTSFISVFSCRLHNNIGYHHQFADKDSHPDITNNQNAYPEIVFLIGLNVDVKTKMSPFAFSKAFSSLRPTTHSGGILPSNRSSFNIKGLRNPTNKCTIG